MKKEMKKIILILFALVFLLVLAGFVSACRSNTECIDSNYPYCYIPNTEQAGFCVSCLENQNCQKCSGNVCKQGECNFCKNYKPGSVEILQDYNDETKSISVPGFNYKPAIAKYAAMSQVTDYSECTITKPHCFSLGGILRVEFSFLPSTSPAYLTALATELEKVYNYELKKDSMGVFGNALSIPVNNPPLTCVAEGPIFSAGGNCQYDCGALAELDAVQKGIKLTSSLCAILASDSIFINNPELVWLKTDKENKEYASEKVAGVNKIQDNTNLKDCKSGEMCYYSYCNGEDKDKDEYYTTNDLKGLSLSCPNAPLADCDDNPLGDPDICWTFDGRLFEKTTENYKLIKDKIDCNDINYFSCAKCINPRAKDVCDSIDNNCDSYVDMSLVKSYEGICSLCCEEDKCMTGSPCKAFDKACNNPPQILGSPSQISGTTSQILGSPPTISGLNLGIIYGPFVLTTFENPANCREGIIVGDQVTDYQGATQSPSIKVGDDETNFKELGFSTGDDETNFRSGLVVPYDFTKDGALPVEKSFWIKVTDKGVAIENSPASDPKSSQAQVNAVLCPKVDGLEGHFHIDIDGSTAMDGTTERLPADPDGVVDIKLKIENIEYGPNNPYCGIPKKIYLEANLEGWYYDWPLWFQAPIFDMVRKIGISGFADLFKTLSIKQDLSKFFITTEKIKGSWGFTGPPLIGGSGLGDDSTYIKEKIIFEIIINPNGKEEITIKDKVIFHKGINKIKVGSPYKKMYRENIIKDLDISSEQLKQVIEKLKKFLNFNLQKYEGKVELNEEVERKDDELGDGKTTRFYLDHYPLVDRNKDPFYLVNEADVEVYINGKEVESNKFELLKPEEGEDKWAINFSEAPSAGDKIKIVYLAEDGKVETTMNIVFNNVQLDDIEEVKRLIRALKMCCPNIGDESAKQTSQRTDNSITTTGTDSIYLLREPRLFKLDGIGYQLNFENKPLKETTKTFFFNPDDYLIPEELEVYRYEDNSITCDMKILETSSATIGASASYIYSSDRNLKIDFEANTFLNSTDIRINKIKITCPITTDSDGDGIFDDVDNCFYIANPAQVDENGNGVGDVCEEGLINDVDFKRLYNPADTNEDDIISMTELIGSIKKWLKGETQTSELITAIYEWQYLY